MTGKIYCIIMFLRRYWKCIRFIKEEAFPNSIFTYYGITRKVRSAVTQRRRRTQTEIIS